MQPPLPSLSASGCWHDLLVWKNRASLPLPSPGVWPTGQLLESLYLFRPQVRHRMPNGSCRSETGQFKNSDLFDKDTRADG